MVPPTDRFDSIPTTEHLTASWHKVRANRGAPGLDWETIERMERRWPTVLPRLQEQLRAGTYRPSPTRRVCIPKPNGTPRPLGIPTVRDRIVQQAVRGVIEPVCDPTFESFSYGFRPGKSAKQALARVDEILASGQRWVIQVDLAGFFDSIPHATIMAALERHVADERIRDLVRRFLVSGVMEDGRVRHSTTGTPQGGVISPLLANLVLDAVDKYVASHGPEGMVRYADDFVICCRTRRRAQHVYREVVPLLRNLGLTVNEEKSSIRHVAERFTFLGYEFGGGGYYPGEGGTTVAKLWKRPSAKAIQAFKDKVRFLTRRQQPRNLRMLTDRCNAAIRGWGHYFREGSCKTRYRSLDEWYRMRLRAFITKRKSYRDNMRTPTARFREMGFCFLGDVLVPVQLALRV